MSAVVDSVEIFIPLDDLLDYEAEFERLEKEKARLAKEVERLNKKLENQGFISKAPKHIVDEERQKLIKYEDMYKKVEERLAIVAKKI